MRGSTVRHRGLRVLVACTLVSGAGCVSWFLNGGVEHSGPPPAGAVQFTVPTCSPIAGGASIAGPADQTYYLANEQRGLVLYELDRAGSGTAVTNRWRDQRGDNFFVWVSSGPGWVYNFPPDRTQNPTRYVFEAGAYGTQSQNGVTMPTGQPSMACPMIPVQQGGPPPVAAPLAPAPSAAPPPAPAPPTAPSTAPPTPPPTTPPTAPPTAPPVSPGQGSAPASGGDCFPPCRSGYVCHEAACVSACNPPCASGQTCGPDGTCHW